MIFQKLLKSLGADQRAHDRRAEEYRKLIRQEAKIGGQIFGPLPQGHHREFFCLDEHTWVWYEEWTGANKQRQSKTTRYDIRPNGVVKVQDGHPSQYVGLYEARHLYQAVDMYNQRVDAAYGLS